MDRFHQGNSTKEAERLRWMRIVPELNGVNSQAAEQLYREMGRSLPSLTGMCPSTLFFIQRLLIHLHNNRRNERILNDLKKRTDLKTHIITTDEYERFIITRKFERLVEVEVPT